MSKSKALSIEQTQTLRRRGRGVPKKSLDTGDRFIDGLKLANAFGVVDRTNKELRAMDSLIRDVKFAVRGLLKKPAFTVIAVLTLALGIGANTAIFSVVNAVLLKPLAAMDPDRLMTFWHSAPAKGLKHVDVN